MLSRGSTGQRAAIRAEKLFRWNDLIGPPAVHGADVHVLDETYDGARAAEALHEIERRVVVLAALDDRVDLDRLEACAARRLDSGEHGREIAASAVHLLEDLLVEAVETHGEALQTRGLELGRVLGEPRAVGRERDVLDALEARERGHDLDDVAPQQRLAAGEPELLDAELANRLATRLISPAVSQCERGRNWWCSP